MTTKTYRVICKDCKESEDIVIDERNNIYWKPVKNIISGRYRLDMQWGWQCICQNNDIMTKQELEMIADTANPKPQELSSIIKNLQPQKPMFIMELLDA